MAASPEENGLDKRLIEDLVMENRYKDAFNVLPEYLRASAIGEIQSGVRLGLRTLLWEITDDPGKTEAYQLRILKALQDDNLKEAAILLVAHRDNFDIFKELKAEAAAAEEKGKSRPSKIPYYPLHNTKDDESQSDAEAINRGAFSQSCEQLAREVFDGTDPLLAAWLREMKSEYQVPSEYDARHFAKEKIRKLRVWAERKLRQKPPLPLQHNESNTYYHPEKFEDELVAEFERRQANLGFGNLVEYVMVELLNRLKDKMRIKRALKSSPEEDNFWGSDVVIETTEGLWCSLDVCTVGSSTRGVEKKEERSQKNRVFLPNLTAMLVQEGEIERGETTLAAPIVQPVDRELITCVTKKYLAAIKNGKPKSVVDIFRETAAMLGKNAEEEEAKLGIAA